MQVLGDLCVVSYWIDTLVLKNRGKFLHYFAASPFPLQGKTNACSRGSIDPFSTIGIGLPDWLVLNTYDDAYMRLKKIAIATKRRGYDDYYLLVVFDIRIDINA